MHHVDQPSWVENAMTLRKRQACVRVGDQLEVVSGLASALGNLPAAPVRLLLHV